MFVTSFCYYSISIILEMYEQCFIWALAIALPVHMDSACCVLRMTLKCLWPMMLVAFVQHHMCVHYADGSIVSRSLIRLQGHAAMTARDIALHWMQEVQMTSKQECHWSWKQSAVDSTVNMIMYFADARRHPLMHSETSVKRPYCCPGTHTCNST